MARSGGIRRGLTAAFLGVVTALLGAAGVALAGGADPFEGMTPALLLLAGFVVLGVGACWIGFTLFDGHFDDLERLRAAAAALDPAVEDGTALPAAADEAGRLAEALAGLVDRGRAAAAMPERRLAAIVGALDHGVLAVTEDGLISLANGAALAALGADRVGIGTSVFDVVAPESLTAAIALARAQGRPVALRLARPAGGVLGARVAAFAGLDGAVIMLSDTAGDAAPGIAHDLRLHDRPPPPPPLDDALPLDELPVLVLDTETTGLDVADDRIVAIGAVRLHGPRLYPAASIDRLVRPGRPIPAVAMRVHGITDAMAADAPPFESVWPLVAPLLDGCVLVGHNIGFDRALLARHCAEAGLPWPDPPTLCTAQLAAALNPGQEDLNLEALAERFGIPPTGRHTAYGDALLTAALYLRLLAQMKDAGATTLGAARALAARPTHLHAAQRRAGW